MCFTGRPMMVHLNVFFILSPLINKKNCQSWTPSDKTFWIPPGRRQHVTKSHEQNLTCSISHNFSEVYLAVRGFNSACWVIFHVFSYLLIAFKIIFFEKIHSRLTISVSNSLDWSSLDPDKARHFIRPDLGLNCLQRLTADDTSKQRIRVCMVLGKVNWSVHEKKTCTRLKWNISYVWFLLPTYPVFLTLP